MMYGTCGHTIHIPILDIATLKAVFVPSVADSTAHGICR